MSNRSKLINYGADFRLEFTLPILNRLQSNELWWGRRDSPGVVRHFEPLTSAIFRVYGFLHALLKVFIPNGQ